MEDKKEIKYYYRLSVSKTRENPDYKEQTVYSRQYGEAVSPMVTEQTLETALTEEQWLVLQKSVLSTF